MATKLSEADPAPAPAAPEAIPADKIGEHVSSLPVVDLLSADSPLRAVEALKDFKGVEGLAKSFIDTQKMVGADKGRLLLVPGEDASEEEVAEFQNKLGRPSDAKGYEFEAPKLPDGLSVNEEVIDQFREHAHKVGLSAKQAAAVYDWYMGLVGGQYAAQMEESEAKTKAEDEALRKEFGAAYDHKLERAKTAIRHFTKDEDAAGFKEWLDKTGIGDDPHMIRFMAKVGESLKEDSIGGGKDNTYTLTPEMAMRRIDANKADAAFTKKLYNADDPGHDAAVREMQELHEQAFPDEKRS